MNLLLVSLFFILLGFNGIVRVHTDGNPGEFVCIFFGYTKLFCDKLPQLDKIPKECTSLIIDGYKIDRISLCKNNSLSEIVVGMYDVTIDMVYEKEMPVYPMFTHAYSDNFRYDSDNIEILAQSDAVKISELLDSQENIKGFIFNDIDLSMYTQDVIKFGNGLQKYLHNLRTTICGNIMIGIMFDGKELLNTTNTAGLDISLFDMEVDYYFIKFNMLNNCSSELRTGVNPITSTGETKSLEMVVKTLEELKIKKEKTYFIYGIYPWAANVYDNMSRIDAVCNLTYGKMCSNPLETEDWCADTSCTLREKGKFAKEYAAGVVVECVDLNDIDQVCKCGTPVPSLNYIIDGWNGKTDYPVCPLFDRIAA